MEPETLDKNSGSGAITTETRAEFNNTANWMRNYVTIIMVLAAILFVVILLFFGMYGKQLAFLSMRFNWHFSTFLYFSIILAFYITAMNQLSKSSGFFAQAAKSDEDELIVKAFSHLKTAWMMMGIYLAMTALYLVYFVMSNRIPIRNFF